MQSPKGQAWFCTTGLPSDLVADMSFHLHKFPLMAKSRKLHRMITEKESNSKRNIDRDRGEEGEAEAIDEEEEEEEEIECRISFPEFPGGSEPFEQVAKFCYGVKIELTSSNVASLRCAAEFLEMTEEYSEENLVNKTELFLEQKTLKSAKEAVKALKSCEKVMLLAEELSVAERCVEAIVSRVGSADPALFGWPAVDGDSKASMQELRKGKKGGRGTESSSSWFVELALLSLPLFKRLILGMRANEVSSEVFENCLIFYAKRYIPGISRSSRMSASSPTHSPSQTEQRELLETVVSNLPLKKSSRSSPATRYLFGLLRTANILNATDSCKSVLEEKIGLVLDQATLDDLLIPSYSYLNETLYDIDCMERILRYFLDSLERRSSVVSEDEEEEEEDRSPALVLVGKLIAGYLSEIASDANLKPDKFINLAVSLPEHARVYDDGLYRAVDVYLKAHPWLPETEREEICGIMDCQKLTLDACTHAAENEQLPLRAVVQVLFFEQLQLRQAIAGSLIAAEGVHSGHLRSSAAGEDDRGEAEARGVMVVHGAPETRSTWKSAVRENQVLRLDMDSMRTRVHQLESECSTMKKVIESIDKSDPSESKGWRVDLSKRFGCKFKTQVCDSHESTVVDARRSRRHQQ